MKFDPLPFYKKGCILPPTCRSTSGTVTDARPELPQGTLDLLIFEALSLEPMPGWALSERVQPVSRTGRKRLEAEAQDWKRLTTAVALVLRMS